MIIKEENYLQYPLTEILEMLPENESIIFAYDSN